MKTLQKLLIPGLVAGTLTGCATQSFTLTPGATRELPDGEISQPFFIGGLGQKKLMNAADVCGGAQKVARIETIGTTLNVVLSYITGCIYTPRTARVYCVKN